MNDYMMNDDDKAKLIEKLQSDIGFEDEYFEVDDVSTSNASDEAEEYF